MTQRAYGQRWRRVLPVIALAAIASVVAACGSSGGSTPATAKQTIRVLYTSTETSGPNPMTAVINGFEAKHPNIKVVLSLAPVTNYPEVLLTQIQSGNGPDIFHGTIGFGQPLSLGKLAKGGDTVPLTQSWATSLVPPNQKPLFELHGVQFAVPDGFQPVGLVYNTAALKKTGLTPPTDLSELYANCAKAAAAGKSYINLAGAATVNTGIMMTSIEGSTVYSQDPDWNAQKAAGKVSFATSPLWKNALQTVLNLNSHGCFQKGVQGGSLTQLFPAVAQGQSLSMFAPVNVVSDLGAMNKDGSFSVAPFPGQTASQTGLVASASDANSVWSGSKHKAAALLFLQYMSTPAVLDSFSQAIGLASLTSLTTGKYGSDLSLIAPQLQSGKFFADGSLYWPNAQVFTALTAGVQGLLTGQTSVESLLQSMDSAWSSGQ